MDWRLTITDGQGPRTRRAGAAELKRAFHAATDRPEVITVQLWDAGGHIFMTWAPRQSAPCPHCGRN